MPQVIITTSRLILRPLAASPSHVNLIITLDTSPAVMRYLENKLLTTAQATADHAARLETSTKVDGLGYWVGYRDADVMGWFSLAPIVVDGAVESTQAEIGYRLLPEFWRQGYAKEGVRALLKYGFEAVRLAEVRGETMCVNEASRRTMAACGMRFVRRFWVDFEDPVAVAGTAEGEAEYRIGREEWDGLEKEKKRFMAHVEMP